MHAKHEVLVIPGSEGQLLTVMEGNSGFANSGFANFVGDDVAVSLLMYFQCFSTIHRELFQRLILVMKDRRHFAHPIYLIPSP